MLTSNYQRALRRFRARQFQQLSLHELEEVDPEQAKIIARYMAQQMGMFWTEPQFKLKKELRAAVRAGEEVTIGGWNCGNDRGWLEVKGPNWWARVYVEAGKVIKIG